MLELVLAIFFISIMAILFYLARVGGKLKKILTGLGLKGQRFLISRRWEENFQGTKLTLNYEGTSLSISVPLRSNIGFSLMLKESVEELERAYGIVVTGHKDFDDRFAIITNHEQLMVEIFQDVRLREVVKKIFAPPVDSIVLDGKNLGISVSIKSIENPSELKEVLPSFLQLKELIEDALKVSYVQEVKVPSLSMYLLYTFPLILMVLEIALGIYLEYLAKRSFPPFGLARFILTSILLFLPVGAIYVRLSYSITKRHPASFRSFSISLLLIIISCFSSFPLVQALNGYFDNSSPKEERYYVMDKTFGEGESYYLFLSKKKEHAKGFLKKYMVQLRHPGINVKRRDYLTAEPGITMVQVYLRDGFLGIRWVERYVLIESPPAGRNKAEIGYWLYRKGDLDGAIREYTRHLEEKGDDAVTYYNRGVALIKKGLYDEALADFERALKIKPDMKEAYKNIDWI